MRLQEKAQKSQIVRKLTKEENPEKLSCLVVSGAGGWQA